MSSQRQFLDVVDREVADARFREAVSTEPLGIEDIGIQDALGRVLAHDVTSAVDVPSFDRSNYDGFAVRAQDTFGATEESPRRLNLIGKSIVTAMIPETEVEPGGATQIATGAMVPRGADAVIMVEQTEASGDLLTISGGVNPGFGISFAGTDMTAGEVVLRAGTVLTSRETGVLAAVGIAQVPVFRRPRVAIISTGDELVAPGTTMVPPAVYDSNGRILADAVRELGAQAFVQPIVPDDLDALREVLTRCVADYDVVLLSGGTSKGDGDLCYEAVAELGDPGIVAHGVALKPGKPICLAGTNGKPVVVLPGFPTSAIFTFHEFVAPVLRQLGGLTEQARATREATLAVKVASVVGRTEYLLTGLVEADEGLKAYPMGKGSGSVTAFSRADGFVTIDRHTEIVEAGTPVTVQLLGRDLELADFVAIGSHCVGLDYLLGEMRKLDFRVKFLAVGSTGGLSAAQRGECDIAGIHLLDAQTGKYNQTFLGEGEVLVQGYGRRQGIVFKPSDPRFDVSDAEAIWERIRSNEAGRMVNRNAGSGTRVLIDEHLRGARPDGYAVQTRSHNAVAASVAQGRADWGVAIESVALRSELGFIPFATERYDFVVPKARHQRPAVQAFVDLLKSERHCRSLRELVLELDD